MARNEAPNAAGISIELAQRMLIRFDGNKAKLYEFVDNCDKAYSLVSEINKPVLKNIIETQLTDNARILIRNRNFADWPELKTYLLDAYAEKRTTSQWQLELNSCKQNVKENVMSYANRIENCYIKLINSLDNNLSVEGRQACITLLKNQALNVFITGLNRDLAIMIKSQKPENLEEAISLALTEEQEQLSKTEIQGFQNINNSHTRHCTYCNKTGHSSFNCHLKNRNFPSINPNIRVKDERQVNHYQTTKNYNARALQSNAYNRQPKFNPNNQFHKYCNYCKNNGHTITECRKREYNNKRRNSQPNHPQSNRANTPSTANNSGNLNSQNPGTVAGSTRTAHQITASFPSTSH